jgi:hypothetical protein
MMMVVSRRQLKYHLGPFRCHCNVNHQHWAGFEILSPQKRENIRRPEVCPAPIAGSLLQCHLPISHAYMGLHSYGLLLACLARIMSNTPFSLSYFECGPSTAPATRQLPRIAFSKPLLAGRCLFMPPENPLSWYLRRLTDCSLLMTGTPLLQFALWRCQCIITKQHSLCLPE